MPWSLPRKTHRTVEWPEMPTQIRKINKTIDRAQHVIGRHEFVEAKVVEKALLYYESIAHHRRISLPPQIERITAKRWSRTLFKHRVMGGCSPKVKIGFPL